MRHRDLGRCFCARCSPTPGGVAVIAPAEKARALARLDALVVRLVAAEDELRRFCGRANFGGDREACRGFADAVRKFIDDKIPKARAALEVPDAARFTAYMVAGSRILATAENGPNDLGAGLIVTEEIAKTAEEIARTATKAAVGGLGAVAVVAGVAVAAKLAGVF